jgi:hypothetical protein
VREHAVACVGPQPIHAFTTILQLLHDESDVTGHLGAVQIEKGPDLSVWVKAKQVQISPYSSGPHVSLGATLCQPIPVDNFLKSSNIPGVAFDALGRPFRTSGLASPGPPPTSFAQHEVSPMTMYRFAEAFVACVVFLWIYTLATEQLRKRPPQPERKASAPTKSESITEEKAA